MRSGKTSKSATPLDIKCKLFLICFKLFTTTYTIDWKMHHTSIRMRNDGTWCTSVFIWSDPAVVPPLGELVGRHTIHCMQGCTWRTCGSRLYSWPTHKMHKKITGVSATLRVDGDEFVLQSNKLNFPPPPSLTDQCTQTKHSLKRCLRLGWVGR